MLTAERLNLRLFVDGVEIPVIGAQCTFPESGASSAEIQVIPTDQVYAIEPRAFVCLFTYDPGDWDRAVDDDDALVLQRRAPDDLRRWKLLWHGEYVSFAFNKHAAGRSASLLCADLTNYWDSIRQHYVNFSNGGIELIENAFLGVRMDRIKNYDVVTKDLASNLFVWLTQSKGPDGKPSLYLGVQRLLREMWFASSNFYAKAFNRLRIGDQIVGLANDESAAKLFQLQYFEKFIKNQVGGGGDHVSLRQMLDTLLTPVFHTTVSIPSPYFDRKGRARGFSPSSKNAQDEVLLSESIDRSKSWPEASLNSTVIKPDSWFLAPPACNVIFPDQYTQFNMSRNFLAEPTRLFVRTSLLFSGADKWMTERFYAPDFEVFNQLLYKEGGYLERLSGTLLPHETFVGITPTEAWKPDLEAYVQSGPRREYLARLADYMFWKARFGARTAQLSGPYNRNLIAGYPAVVFDRAGARGELTQHWIGNLQSVTHTVNQDGGTTHVNLVGVHSHDETADFDEKGRSLEEVTSRGTDGFLDNRYDVERIGAEVYKTLFGCGSIYDIAFNLDIQDNLSDPSSERSVSSKVADKLNSMGSIAASVSTLQLLYQTVKHEGGSIDAFIKSVTHRPKANLVEMLGSSLSINGVDALGDAQRKVLEKEDPALLANEGFFCTATDPEAETTRLATFVSVSRKEVSKEVVTVVPARMVPSGVGDNMVVAVKEDVRRSTTVDTVTTKSTGNYELASHLEARQAKVLAYTESLKYRGVRG